MHCFSYGSNLSIRRLRARVPSARFLAVASLPGHRLLFHKRSRADGSAKCDAFYTGSGRDRVIGVVYDIDSAQKGYLDRVEGLGKGYDEKMVTVTTGAGEAFEAQVYVATDIDPELKPFRWYREHVRIGAQEHGFPAPYIEWIERVPAREDPKPWRHAREIAIYAPHELSREAVL